jgi:hypothetical protein
LKGPRKTTKSLSHDVGFPYRILVEMIKGKTDLHGVVFFNDAYAVIGGYYITDSMEQSPS